MNGIDRRCLYAGSILFLTALSLVLLPTEGSLGSIARGKEFYLAFPQHIISSNDSDLSAVTIFLVVANPTEESVTVNVTFPKMPSVAPLSINVPAKGSLKQNVDQNLQLIGSSKQSKGVYVVASDTIEVQVASVHNMFNLRSKAMYSALPAEMLSKEYVIVTLCKTNHCFCAIVLTQDGTDVTVNLRLPANEQATYGGGIYGNDTEIQASGDKGDVIQITCFECDLSGTIVRSSHDVAVVAGGEFTNSSAAEGKDMVMKQFFPWSTSGNHFILPPDLILQQDEPELVKIVTGDAGTQFQYNGTTHTSTFERQVFEFTHTSKRIEEIVASDRILVVQFFDPSGTGIQMMQISLPYSSWQTSYSIFADGNDTETFVLVLVVETAAAPLMITGDDTGTTGIIKQRQTPYGNYTLLVMELGKVSQRLTVQCSTNFVECRPFWGFVFSVNSPHRGWSLPLLPETLEDFEVSTVVLETTSPTTEQETTILTDNQTTVLSTEQGTAALTTEVSTGDAHTTNKEPTGSSPAELSTMTSLSTDTSPTQETTQTVFATGSSSAQLSTVNSPSTETSPTQETTQTVFVTPTAPPLVPWPKKMVCPCNCMHMSRNQTILSTKELEELVNDIRKELAVNPTEQSQAKRKKQSVLDSKPASVASGTLAIVLLVLVVGAVVLSDILTAYGSIRVKARKLWRRNRITSRE